MGQGLRTWDAAGNLILDTTDFLGRITNVVDIPASNTGSTTVSVPAEGTQFSVVLATSGTTSAGASNPRLPTVSLVGTTLSWSNPHAIAFKYIMGVY